MPKKLLMTASVWAHIRNFHLPYLREFQNRGWETHVGCAGIPGDAPYTDRAIALPFEKRMTAPSNLRAAGQLRALIRAERYDLIITHTALAAFFTRLAVKGLRGRPPLVNVVHGYLFDASTPAPRQKLLLAAERLTAPETDLLLTMNRFDAALAEGRRLGREIAFIPGVGVDFTRLDAAAGEDAAALRGALGIPPETFVLLYAAEFSPRKSQSVLLRALKLLGADTALVLCGDGDTRQQCMALAAELGLRDRVFFPGQIADMTPWYRMADAVVSASRSEGLPFNIMEAMYAGLPVAASAVKGHADLIADGENGLLYPYGDAAACAACIRRLAGDAALRQRLGGRAHDDAMQYALERVLPIVMAQYLRFDTD